MNAYVIGGDVLGENADLSTTTLCRERPMSANNARKLIALCVRRLQGKGIGMSPTAHQLVKIDESIVVSGKKKLPDSAADVLCSLAARAVGECEILGSHDPRPYWAQGINPYLEVEPIYDYPPDDEWLVPKAGGGYQKVILGADAVGAGEMVPGGWWYTGSHRGPWWGGNGPFMEVDDWVDPMSLVDPSILGAYDQGGFDIAAAQKKMNELPKKITIRIAQALLRAGQGAIEGALAIAAKKNLPGGAARKNVQDHLGWHAKKIHEMASVGASPNAFYDPGQDLAKYVVMAFIEANAAEEGAAYLTAAWSRMWQEIGQAIAALPADIRKVVTSSVGGLIQTITGLPVWAWALLGIGTLAGLGFILWKLINSKAGVAVAGVATKRFLR